MVSGTQDTHPPSYPGQANFSPISLQSSTNCLQLYIGMTNSSWGAICFTSAGRVTLAGGTTFSHINNLACLPSPIFAFRVTRNVWFLA